MKENNKQDRELKEIIIQETAVAVMDKEGINVSTKKFSDDEIEGMIYNVRGQQVMLDSDLAQLYGYEVKRLNEQVKRNIERFPADFMFQLTEEEIPKSLKSQFATLNKNENKRGLHIKKMPYAFTEQGVYQLATVLKGPVAAKQSVNIMRVFVKMRHYLIENSQLLGNTEILKITHSLIEDNIKIKEEIVNNYKESRKDVHDIKKEMESIKDNMTTKDDMQNAMNKILDSFIPKENLKQFVFKDGQPFEANNAYIDIYKEAKHSIYIIDDYINCHTLSLLTSKKKNVDVIIFSDNKGRGSHKLNKLEFDNFNIEYPTLFIKKNNNRCHDRFIVLDYKMDTEKIYHCGASSKDAGKRVCGISQFSTTTVIHPIIDELLLHDDLELF